MRGILLRTGIERVVRLGVLLVLVAVTVVALTTAVNAASDPPEPGEVLVDDPLKEYGVVRAPFTTPSGKNSLQFTDDGYHMRVTGPGNDANPNNASVGGVIRELTLLDGEIRVEVRVEQADQKSGLVGIQFRVQPDQSQQYQVWINPTLGTAQMVRFAGGQRKTLAMRGNLEDVVSPDGWNILALRAHGADFWFFVNDQLALTGNDATFESGRAILFTERIPNVPAEMEVTATFRNIRLSQLLDGDAAHASLYQRPS